MTEIQQRTAEQLFRTLGELKGGAMKFGQALSILEAALPEEMAAPYREHLTKLQDSAPPMPTQTVRDILAADLGPDWKTGWSGSTADRPRPRRSGRCTRGAGDRRDREVAVKVQYPGAGEALDVRPQPARPGRRARSAPLIPGVDIKPLIEEIQARANDELDYQLEAEAQRAFAAAFAEDPEIVVPDVVAVGPTGAHHRVAGDARTRSRPVITDGTQEERDHYGELYVRFLFSGPARTGMLHADPHPGNYRIIPNADGSPGRLGVLDFGAVARLAEGGLPEAMGRLIRLRADRGRRRACIAGLREEGFIKDRINLDPELLIDYLSPFVEPTQTERFRFSRAWMREQFQRINNPREPDVHGRDQAQPAAVVPPHPPHLARRHRGAEPARGRGAVPGDHGGVPPRLRRRLTRYSPVSPSIDSRIRSAWPLCRAYSSIMCSRIQRRLKCWSPFRVGCGPTGCRRPSAWQAPRRSPCRRERRPRRRAPSSLGGVVGRGVPLPVAVGVPVGHPGHGGISSPPASISSNHQPRPGQVLHQSRRASSSSARASARAAPGSRPSTFSAACRGGSRGRPGSMVGSSASRGGSVRSVGVHAATLAGGGQPSSPVSGSPVGQAVRAVVSGRPAPSSPGRTLDERRAGATCRAVSASRSVVAQSRCARTACLAPPRAVAAAGAAAGPRDAVSGNSTSGRGRARGSQPGQRRPEPALRVVRRRRDVEAHLVDRASGCRRASWCGRGRFAGRVRHEAEREPARRREDHVAVVRHDRGARARLLARRRPAARRRAGRDGSGRPVPQPLHAEEGIAVGRHQGRELAGVARRGLTSYPVASQKRDAPVEARPARSRGTR